MSIILLCYDIFSLTSTHLITILQRINYTAPLHFNYFSTQRNNTMSIEEEVINIIKNQLDVSPEAIVPEAYLLEDLGADSLDITELIMAIEEHFNINISDDEAQNIHTVQDAINHIKNYIH